MKGTLHFPPRDHCPRCGWTWKRATCGPHCYHMRCDDPWHDDVTIEEEYPA